MKIIEQTPDRLVIETTPGWLDNVIFAAPIIGSAAGIAAFAAWGLTFISSALLLCVPIAVLFLISRKSFFSLKHTYSVDKAKNEFVIREQHGAKTKQLRSTVNELKWLKTETLGLDTPCFYIVVGRKTLPRSMLEVEGFLPDDEAAFDAIMSFVGSAGA